MTNEAELAKMLSGLAKPQMLRKPVGPVRLARRSGIIGDWLDTPKGERTPGLYVTCDQKGARFEEVDHIFDVTYQRMPEHTVDDVSIERATQYLDERGYDIEKLRRVLSEHKLDVN